MPPRCQTGSRLGAAAIVLVAAVATTRAVTLFDNGSLVTNPGAGAGGFDVSQASSDFNTLGFSVASPQRLADDFTVAAPGWRVSGVTVSAYIAGAYPVPPVASPFSALTLNLWRGGPPEQGAAELVATSTALTGNAFSGIYRVANGAANFSSTARPVFHLTASFPDTELSPGNYWIDYSVTGSGGIVFSPMVMTGTPAAPLTRPGNAQRKLDPSGSWVTLFGGLSSQGLDFPFVVSGAIVPEPAAAAALLPIGLLARWRRGAVPARR